MLSLIGILPCVLPLIFKNVLFLLSSPPIFEIDPISPIPSKDGVVSMRTGGFGVEELEGGRRVAEDDVIIDSVDIRGNVPPLHSIQAARA